MIYMYFFLLVMFSIEKCEIYISCLFFYLIKMYGDFKNLVMNFFYNVRSLGIIYDTY